MNITTSTVISAERHERIRQFLRDVEQFQLTLKD